MLCGHICLLCPGHVLRRTLCKGIGGYPDRRGKGPGIYGGARCGEALNPMSVEGQIEGAVQMGLGYALSEGIIIDSGGKVKNTTFKQYHIMNAGEMPPIKWDWWRRQNPPGHMGQRASGSVRWYSAGAIANAVANAIGCEVHRLPLKPDTVLELLPGKMRQLKEGMESPYEI